MKNDNVFIDELCEKPKKKDSGKKGKGAERDLCKIFNTRFEKILSENPSWGKFHRVIQSGNRISQVSLAEENQSVFAGDVFCKNFNFVIESKKGYDLDLTSAFEGGIKEIDAFLKQVESYTEITKKKPLLLWKKDYRPTLAFLKEIPKSFPYQMNYRNWIVLSLTDLLTLEDEFFFKG